MSKKLLILDSAQEDFKDIKRYVQQSFGRLVWNTVNAEYKHAFRRIQTDPQWGSVVEELAEVGITHVRYILVRQTKIVYEVTDEFVLIHLFIHTKRDFRSQLFQRLLR